MCFSSREKQGFIQHYFFFLKRKSVVEFTLVEFLVVIGIIGLLASIVMVSLSSAREKSRDARRIADLDTVKKALELYYIDNYQFPDDNGPSTPDSDCTLNGTILC